MTCTIFNMRVSPSGVFPFLTMKKIYTIKQNSVFTRMYTKGKNCVLPTVVLYVRKNPRLEHSEIGIIIGRKLGGAVQRNRARRIIREAWRLLICENEGLYDMPFYVVVVARSRCFKKTTKMQMVKKDLYKGLLSLGLLKNQEEI